MPMDHLPINIDGGAGTPAKHIDLNALGVQGNWCPITPVRISMVGIVVMNDIAAAGAVEFRRRPTAGSATGEVTVATVNLLATHTQGQVVYVNGLNHMVMPGSELTVEVTDVTGAGDLGRAVVWLDYSWEYPQNIQAMVAST